MLKLSRQEGKFINTDGYVYGQIPKLLKEKFGEIVYKTKKTSRNIWYYTRSGYIVSSNGYVHKKE